MGNERLRNALRSNGYSEAEFAHELGVDAKTVQRWITKSRTPHRSTATRAARLLAVPDAWLWPELDKPRAGDGSAEVCAFYPHRSETPKHLWLDLVVKAREQIDMVAYASLFFPEENPDAINIIRHKAESGTRVRIALGDPDSPEVELRGREEQLYDALIGRVRMALAYYRPLMEAVSIDFRLHRTTLYNSIFRFDDQMLINQHIFGVYGYMAPILHLRRVEGAGLFDTYVHSFERIWQEAYAVTDSVRQT
jgi:transcriptional regulator with XRE-family HTH domain